MHTNISVIQTNAWESRDLNFKFTFSHSNSLYALWSAVPLQSFRSGKEMLELHEFFIIWTSSNHVVKKQTCLHLTFSMKLSIQSTHSH